MDSGTSESQGLQKPMSAAAIRRTPEPSGRMIASPVVASSATSGRTIALESGAQRRWLSAY